jgi:hypothetical protein
MLQCLRHLLGLYGCFACGRPRWRHSADQATRCDYAPLPIVVATTGAAEEDDDRCRSEAS